MSDVMISGVPVKFPNKPYPSQFSMMSKIIRGLQKGENCLLESPTGSGKTLSLICSTIAWQQTEKANQIKAIQEDSEMRIQKIKESCYCDCKEQKLKKKHIEIEIDSDNSPIPLSSDDDAFPDKEESFEKQKNAGCPCICHGMYGNDLLDTAAEEIKKIKKIPTIYFATRTHKQIANVIKEFKKTSYGKDSKMTILASRGHTCIHSEVSKLSYKDEACKKLIKPSKTGGYENGTCTFYHNFKKKPLSYENYGFKNVWDIEDLVKSFKKKKICPYYASREIKDVVDIVFCPYNYLIDPRIRSSMKIDLEGQIVIVDEAHNVEDSCRESAMSVVTQNQLETSLTELDKMLKSKFLPNDIREASQFFRGVYGRFSDWIGENASNMESRDFETAMSRIYTGLDMVAILKEKIKIGPEVYTEYEAHKNAIMSEPDKEDENPIEIPEGIKTLADHLFLAMGFLYMNSHHYMDDFKVAIIRTKLEDVPKPPSEDLNDSTQPTISSQWPKNKDKPSNQWTYTIYFWCLNPAVAFQYLKNCHSIILCSGTLSPMDTFQSELGVKFEHQLEANHVITDKQVWVGCLGSGPTGVSLLSTYKMTESWAYQDEIGRLVLDVCSTMPYGVLIFVPSYSLLSKLLNRWNDTQMSDQIKKYKEIFSETRVAKGFDTMLKDYYDCIDSSEGGEFHNGALMLAVYRGRASEGLDFSDNYARAVIAVGIPFPSIKDTQVDLKRKYNNALCKSKNLLNGDAWYEIQAYRAVNQGLGRCIRHRKDWGAIILVDERYFKNPGKYMAGVSKWIRTKFKTYPNYSKAISSLKTFNDNLKDFNRDEVSSQCEQSQANYALSQSQNNCLDNSHALESSSQKENNSQFSNTNDTSYINGKTPTQIQLSQFEFKSRGNYDLKKNSDMALPLTTSTQADANHQFNTPIRTSTQISDSKKNSSKLSSKISFSNSKKRKSENHLESDDFRSDSPDLAAKKSFFNNTKKGYSKNKKSHIEYIDSSPEIMIESDGKTKHQKHLISENTIIDESINDEIDSNVKTSETLEFDCIHCNEFICNLNPSENRDKNNVMFLSQKNYNELPTNLRDYVNDTKLEKLSIISSDLDRISFESNTKLKSFMFFLNSSIKLTQNSFIDEFDNHCWQFYECLQCMKIVGFILKYSNSTQSNFVKNYLGKIIVINDLSNQFILT